MTKSFLIVAALAFTAPAASAQVQNAGPDGSTGGNNVRATLYPPQAAPAQPAPQSSAPASTSTFGAGSYAQGYGAMAQTTGSVEPSNYRTESECLNAAQAAHASLEPCKILPR